MLKNFRFNPFKKREKRQRRLIIKNVPYFSQWESPSLVGRIINDEIAAKEDPLWQQSGASSPEEYEFWANNLCGIACLKMILAHKRRKEIPIIELGKRSVFYGAYKLRDGTIDGMFYAPFLKFIHSEFGLNGRSLSHMSVEDIVKEVGKGNYVIASVNHKIRHPDDTPETKGGHLVLVLGFDTKKQTLYLHNPSGDEPKNQRYAEISYLTFSKFFADRGVVIQGQEI